MADAAEEKPAPPPPKSGGGLAMNAIVSFVMALAAVVAGGYINASLHPLPDMQLDKDGKITAIAPPAKSGHGKEGEGGKPATYFALDPPLVVNFEEGSAVRFLQVSVEIMAKDEKAIESIQKNMPLIRNNLLMLMSNRDYQSLMTREGKEKLRQEALTEVRAVQKKTGGPDVDDLLFTSFVVQ